ncbi:MAG TPA: 1,2-phenylacetyl-CoA epoxidase subunit PaaC [Casimicrobiaceae bacterium]|nr:1,2-phenylacetyl-CoA epoxidase subunit PaaC [Casimicrobiaceae bacterium]
MSREPPDRHLLEFVFFLADNGLVLAQRLSEWVGKGPILEEDIASTNVGLDLLGQARMWFAYAQDIDAKLNGTGRGEDDFAFRRDAHEFRNLLLVEQPNGSYADTIARQFLFDRWHVLLLDGLSRSKDERIAEIAAKSVKEAAYHVERSSDWVIRLGDGTDESHARMQGAIDDLWTYAGEMFEPDEGEALLVADGIAVDVRTLRAPWDQAVDAILREATLARPSDQFVRKGGRCGVHTEHLGRMIAEMQFLQRAYPDARW